MYYQLYDLLTCIDHVCNQELDLVWIAQFWKHSIPINMGYSAIGIVQGNRGLESYRIG